MADSHPVHGESGEGETYQSCGVRAVEAKDGNRGLDVVAGGGGIVPSLGPGEGFGGQAPRGSRGPDRAEEGLSRQHGGRGDELMGKNRMSIESSVVELGWWMFEVSVRENRLQPWCLAGFQAPTGTHTPQPKLGPWRLDAHLIVSFVLSFYE